MSVESIHAQIHRDQPSSPRLDNPEIIEQLRHGNIYEVLRRTINAEDFNKFISHRGHQFENSILQNYQVYAGQGDVPAPSLDSHFIPHSAEMSFSSGERESFHQDMSALQGYEPVTNSKGEIRLQARAVQARAMGISAKADTQAQPHGPGQDVMGIGGQAVQEWQDFFSKMQLKMLDIQMFQQMQAKAADANKDIQRIVAMVMSGQADPEFVVIAAAKAAVPQYGVMATSIGKKIMYYNEDMNKASQALLKMDPNDKGYVQQLQMTQSQSRSQSTGMQLEMMDLQKVVQNIGTTLEFASTAAKSLSQARQAMVQAIAAR